MFTGWETAETFTGNRTALDSISILEQPEKRLNAASNWLTENYANYRISGYQFFPLT